MIDPSTRQLNVTLYRERLQAAEATREPRTSCGAAPGPTEWLWQTIG